MIMNPSFALKRGLARARMVNGISFSGLQYVADLESWCLYFTCRQPAASNKHIPEQTAWVAIISSAYPKGSLEIFPANHEGITKTFQHQEFNAVIHDRHWRAGKICVSGPMSHWGRMQFGIEPITAEKKLMWHLMRSMEWIRKARTGRLAEYGDPFELPDLPNPVNTPIAFNESVETLKVWSAIKGKRGIVTIATLPYDEAKHSVCVQFSTNKGEKIDVEWGTDIRKAVPKHKGCWILLPEIPVNEPWQLAATWMELGTKLGAFGFDLAQLMTRCVNAGASCLMMGFPIPKKIGEEAERIHWLAVQVPQVKISNGFISGSPAHIKHILRTNNRCNWIKTENWSLQDVTSRSKLDKDMITKKILVIGAGSVGSITAELFCRMGCSEIQIMDFDNPTVSNLSRHTLTMQELQLVKAEGVAKRLNATLPYVNAKGIPQSLEKVLKKDPGFLQNFEVIVDITAEDNVIELIETHSTEGQQIVSLSTGYRANRSYCYTGRGGNGLSAAFQSRIRPWTASDTPDDDAELEFEGAGCWHPLFPARYDDILSVISPCIRIIEKAIIEKEGETKLSVIEKTFDSQGDFTGLKITTVADDTLHKRSVA